MIVVRSPMRVSFAGGGTDLPDFYRRHTGRVISTTIDHFCYVVLNRTPVIDKVSARYSIAETVDHPRELQNTRIREALISLGILSNIEIASFATVPAGTGLGSSSSFAVALLKALHAYRGERVTREALAEEACRLEIEILKEPIGKQDQYAAAIGGFNVFEFNADGSVKIKPVLLDYKVRLGLEDHIVLFYSGVSRAASSVLTEQRANVEKKFETMKAMADSVPEFEKRLLHGDFKGLGAMLHEGWMQKKTLATGVSTSALDKLYDAGVDAGAWGGKVLGAGGGGCVLFMVPPAKKEALRKHVAQAALKAGLGGAKEIMIHCTQAGVEMLHNSDHGATFE